MEGFVHKDFSAVGDVFRRQLKRTNGGAAVCIYHRGKPVVDIWGGNRTDDDPWEQDTVAMCFSTTKGVSSTALHVLADRGEVDYDEPVATYWPEFAQGGKQDVTVRHVITHSAGLHRIRSLVDHGSRMHDWDHMVEALAEAEPAYEPGTRHGYHALTYGWLVGEIVRRVSGDDIATFVDKELAQPLELDGLFIGLPRSERHRVAPLATMGLPRPTNATVRQIEKQIGTAMGKVVSAVPGPLNTRRLINALAPRNVEEALYGPDAMDSAMPAANGFFTARSLGRMYGMLAGWGEIDGTRILSEETVGTISTVQRRGRDHVLVLPMDWRLGYHRVYTSRGGVGPAFGHFGFGGSGGWADPSRDLALGFVCSRGSGTPIGDLRIMQLGAAAVAAADKTSRTLRSDSHSNGDPEAQPA
ncbi:MAG: beta-lactamase family protein [Actinomycetia bacterium]|nr:beta-lactamase family protein [Actinomycetes bacterium]